MYVLWSTRSGGWLTKGGTYSSEFASAEQFTYEKALDRCKIHKGGMAQYGLLPVAVAILEALA